MSSPVSIEREDSILRVRLNRPDKLNAFNSELVETIQHAMSAANPEEVRLIVFSGEGKGFSGGFDLSSLEEMSDGDLLLRFVRVEQLLQAVYHSPIATLAFVHGACYGAAADLVAACDWRLADPGARFRMPGLRFGIVLGTQRLANLVGVDTARNLLLRDASFDAAEARDAGFITDVVEQSGWVGLEHEIQLKVSALDPQTILSKKEMMRRDTRAEDMAALVESASRGSVKTRISAYLRTLADARKREMST